jgi:hypothetical protein
MTRNLYAEAMKKQMPPLQPAGGLPGIHAGYGTADDEFEAMHWGLAQSTRSFVDKIKDRYVPLGLHSEATAHLPFTI